MRAAPSESRGLEVNKKCFLLRGSGCPKCVGTFTWQKGPPLTLNVTYGPRGAETHFYLGNVQLSQVEGNREPESHPAPSMNLSLHNAKDTMESIMTYKYHAFCSPRIHSPVEEGSIDSLSSLHVTQSS